MTINEFREKVRLWDRINPENKAVADAEYSAILAHLEHVAKNDWGDYSPVLEDDRFSNEYMERLARWVGNGISEEDQKLLLKYALHISYLSSNDFVALYVNAYQREVFPWIASQIGANLSRDGVQTFQDLVSMNAKSRTWYCPVTSSMEINHFYKVNRISNISHQPDFSSVKYQAENSGNSSGTIDSWKRYMESPNQTTGSNQRLDFIVLLEDIVGSASQCIDTVEWVSQNFGKPVLFVPLIVCPNGLRLLRDKEAKSNGALSVRPVLELSQSDLLGSERNGATAWPISDSLERLAVKVAPKASIGQDPFGYNSTGCSVVKFSNTPDNTLPLVHNDRNLANWMPLFPRVHRD